MTCLADSWPWWRSRVRFARGVKGRLLHASCAPFLAGRRIDDLALKAFNLVLLLPPWAIGRVTRAADVAETAASHPALIAIFDRGIGRRFVAAHSHPEQLHECGDWTGLKAEQATIGGGGKRLSVCGQCHQSAAGQYRAAGLSIHDRSGTSSWVTAFWQKCLPPRLE